MQTEPGDIFKSFAESRAKQKPAPTVKESLTVQKPTTLRDLLDRSIARLHARKAATGNLARAEVAEGLYDRADSMLEARKA